jgi:hypothetical protein
MYLSGGRAKKVLVISGWGDISSDLESQFPDILFNLILTIKVMNLSIFPARIFLDFRQSTPDEVLYAGFQSDVRHEFSLFDLSDIFDSLEFMGKVIRETVKTVSAVQSLEKAHSVCEITLLEFDVGSKLEKALSGRLLRTASQCTKLSLDLQIRTYFEVGIAGKCLDDRSALVAYQSVNFGAGEPVAPAMTIIRLDIFASA